jgi:hypothetical protein
MPKPWSLRAFSNSQETDYRLLHPQRARVAVCCSADCVDPRSTDGSGRRGGNLGGFGALMSGRRRARVCARASKNQWTQEQSPYETLGGGTADLSALHVKMLGRFLSVHGAFRHKMPYKLQNLMTSLYWLSIHYGEPEEL